MRIAKIHLLSAPIVSADDGVGHVFLARPMLSRLSRQPVLEMEQPWAVVISPKRGHGKAFGCVNFNLKRNYPILWVDQCRINRYDKGRKVAALSGREMRKSRSEDVLNTLSHLKIFKRV
jgi:hypothetical protein